MLTPTLPVTVANQIHSNLTLGPGFKIGTGLHPDVLGFK